MTSTGAEELARGAFEVLPAGELERKLALGRPLRVKLGIDPTAPDIHLGHTVVLHKLRDFQDAGHVVVLIIGDFTARLGDPSGRSELRPMLSVEQIEANARTYQEQAFRVLDSDPQRLELRRNSDWLDMSMDHLLALVRTTTVGQLLERDDFAKRRARGEPVSMLELLYPLMQGYDSVAVQADIELGGTDQTFNLLLGRDIQRAYGQAEQAVLTMPLLVGVDGTEKMSKSLRNQIGVTDEPAEIYGRTMSIPDSALAQWYLLLLGRPLQPGADPLAAKRALAGELTAIYHGHAAAEHEAQEWDRVQRGGGLPSEIDEAGFDASGGTVHLPAVIADVFAMSRSEARRLIEQGAVSLDEAVVGGVDASAADLDGRILRVGKRRFVRLVRRGG
ncbi:MAG: tyrosine--tRNA ligase [Solirubrobacteraceae bacterium]|jgi:tyrosyl-tRNA synthetase